LVGRGTVDTESARGIPINQLTILFDQRGEIKKRRKKQKLLTNISRWTWRETGFSVYHTRNPARRLPLILGHAVVNEDGRFRV
jgi:hypothetical protein